MSFRDQFKIDTKVSLVKRSAIFKDKIVLTDAVVVPPIDGFDDEKFIWIKKDQSIYYASNINGAILGYPRTFATLSDDEEIRDNILCRIFDFILIKTCESLEVDNSDKGSCV